MPLFKGSEATLNYKQTGAGPDIVWVSGGGGTIGSWDAYQLPYFDRHFRNTTFDGRGVGRHRAATSRCRGRSRSSRSTRRS